VSKELSSVFEKTYEYYRSGGTYDISTAENSSPYLFAAGVYETFVGQLDPSRYDTYFQVPLQFNEAAENDPYYRLYMEYEDAKAESMRILVAFLTCGVLWLLTVLFLMIIAGKKQEDGSIQLAKIDYLPASLHVLASGIMIALLVMAGLRSVSYMVELDRNYAGANVLPWKLLCAALAVLINLFLIEWGSSLVRQIRGHGFVKNSLTYNLFSKDGRCRTLSSKFVSYCKGVFPVKDKKVKKKLITVMVLYFVFVVLLSIAGWWIGTLLIILASVLLAAYIAHLLQDIQTIDDALAEAEKGSYDYQLQPEKMTDAMKPLGQKVGNLTNGVKLAVETAVKNERQKTDLITGVSHDLKTPLTSIINYTELLKTCNIQDPQAKQYIGVLEEKSAALKKLVEDLLEASKVSSGNLEVHLEKINLSELLEQVYGEYKEPLQEEGLLLKLDTPSAPVYVKADGQKVYRVLENLFSNVQKYSLDNTRVYIDLKQEEKTAMVAVKNISKEEMNYDPAELTERFFRGDRSRTTEGSGLGLSIAESLTTAQNGTFDISIDGDLFKVTIRLPLAE
ncbi:MAG TPA: HAMP domain-containing sensor histidine kinase, partial [Clostridiales bacterium]|nr:HAMP domain-containing sensor histidine kinase [Clostridiales bacterium]